MLRIVCLFVTFCVFSSPLLSQKSEESDVVLHLATESELAPLYLARFYLEDPDLDGFYLQELEKVLSFDLGYNGKTLLTKYTREQERQASQEGFTGYYDRAAWRELGVRYVAKVQVKQRRLSASFFSVEDYDVKSVSDIALTGELAKDRRYVHQLADSMHQAFFHQNGIASTRLLYTSKVREDKEDSSKWVSEVWECDYDGYNPRQVTHEGRYCVTPAYIPPKPGYSSGGFFYVSYRMGQPKIFMASLQDGIGRRFSYLRGNQLMPAIAPQRDQVCFICDVGGNPDVFLQDYSLGAGALGKPRQIFTALRGAQATPSFSPDGKRVAFVSNKDGSPRIYVMEIPPEGATLEDVRPVLVSKRNRENTSPAWSPDGMKLAYSAMSGQTRQIWIYDFSTGEEKQLTHGGNTHKENPTWAPNSLHLAYNSGDENKSELYLINLNQPEAVKVTSGFGEKRFPSWEPRSE